MLTLINLSRVKVTDFSSDERVECHLTRPSREEERNVSSSELHTIPDWLAIVSRCGSINLNSSNLIVALAESIKLSNTTPGGVTQLSREGDCHWQ